MGHQFWEKVALKTLLDFDVWSNIFSKLMTRTFDIWESWWSALVLYLVSKPWQLDDCWKPAPWDFLRNGHSSIHRGAFQCHKRSEKAWTELGQAQVRIVWVQGSGRAQIIIIIKFWYVLAYRHFDWLNALDLSKDAIPDIV